MATGHPVGANTINHRETFPRDLTVNDNSPTTRRRMPYWIGIVALILLFPAIVVPLLVRTSGELPFTSIDQIDVKAVRSLEILIIERPDGGPNIGMPNRLFAIPSADFETFLSSLRNAGAWRPNRLAGFGSVVWSSRSRTDARNRSCFTARSPSTMRRNCSDWKCESGLTSTKARR